MHRVAFSVDDIEEALEIAARDGCHPLRGVGLDSYRREPVMTTTTLLPFQPDQMTPAQQAVVSYLARYAGHTHKLYA